MALAWRHRRLLLCCFLIILLVRLSLLMVGYRPLLRWISRVDPARPSKGNVHLAMWAIRHSSRLVPGATCLTKALAGHYLCARAGHPTVIRIGVLRREDSSVSAHAWLVDGACVLIGGQEEDLGRFTRLADLQGAAR
jgi:hypothetical protein